MTVLEQRLRRLNEIPAPVPNRLAHQAWAAGRRRRRHVRAALGAGVIVAGVTVGVIAAAHPALAEPSSTVAGATAGDRTSTSHTAATTFYDGHRHHARRDVLAAAAPAAHR